MLEGAPPIVILRHGETVWNLEQRIQGRRDSPLTARGRAQAGAQGRLLRALLPGYRGVHAWCSPTGRARATAMIALRGTGLVPKLDDRLQEVSAGDWEGRLRSALYAEFGGPGGIETEFDIFTRAPRGEDIEQLGARCRSFLAGLCDPAVVITHGFTCVMLRGLLLGLDQSGMAALERGQGCLYLLENGTETCLREDAA